MSDFLYSTEQWLPGLAAMLVLMGLSAFLSASETALFFLSHDEIRSFRTGRAASVRLRRSCPIPTAC